MIIVNDDRGGIGRVKGDFVYINLDQDGDLDCGVYLANAETYGGACLSERELIGGGEADDPDFCNTIRSPLDLNSNHKIAILSKDEVGKMIESLQDVYRKME